MEGHVKIEEDNQGMQRSIINEQQYVAEFKR